VGCDFSCQRPKFTAISKCVHTENSYTSIYGTIYTRCAEELFQSSSSAHRVYIPGAARYSTWLLNKLTAKGVVFSFLFYRTDVKVGPYSTSHTPRILEKTFLLIKPLTNPKNEIKEKAKITLFSDHNGSLLRRRPGALKTILSLFLMKVGRPRNKFTALYYRSVGLAHHKLLL